MKNKKRYLLALQLFASEGAEGESAQTGAELPVDAESETGAAADCENEFDELIKTKFKEQFAKRTQAIIDKRFKEYKALEAYRDTVSPIVDELLGENGLEKGDEEKLRGLLLEKTREIPAVKETPGQTIPESFRRDIAGWAEQSEKLKELYPDFDLRSELSAENAFSRLLLGGVSVRDAYETVHRDEILGGAMAYTAGVVREQMVRNIEAKGRRPLENSVGSENAVVTSKSVESLTSGDILKILKQVENGASISF